jgi:diguanylate cyclase (GGDEF)-like protein
MLGVGIFLCLNVLFAAYWLRVFSEQRRVAEANFVNACGRLSALRAQAAALDTENENLFCAVEETVALFDLTRHICKSLDGLKVFEVFKEQLQQFLSVKDCQFLPEKADLRDFKGYSVTAIEIDGKLLGYLAIDDVGPEKTERLSVLTNQFVLGMKRVLLYQRVQELAITDSLTGVFTRRYYMERFRDELERSKKYHLNFSVLMIDVDHFKAMNDKYGHLVGDVVLREVSKTVKDGTRQVDSIGRYGGEEFVILLSETDKNGARFAAERIRQAVERLRIRAYDEQISGTISIGLATYPEDGEELVHLIDKADMALYRAKQNGRNRICIYGINR